MEKIIFEMHQLSRKNKPTLKKTILKSVVVVLGMLQNYIKQRRDTFVFYALILLALVESKKMRLNQNKLSL